MRTAQKDVKPIAYKRGISLVLRPVERDAFIEQHPLVVEDAGREVYRVAQRTHNPLALSQLSQALERRVHVRIGPPRIPHHPPKELLRVDVRHGRYLFPEGARRSRVGVTAASLAPSYPVRLPHVRLRELRSEGREPRVVEGRLPALNELPCARGGGSLLDGVVDVTNWNPILDLVVENGLKRGEDLKKAVVSQLISDPSKPLETHHHTAHVEKYGFWRHHCSLTVVEKLPVYHRSTIMARKVLQAVQVVASRRKGWGSGFPTGAEARQQPYAILSMCTAETHAADLA